LEMFLMEAADLWLSNFPAHDVEELIKKFDNI